MKKCKLRNTTMKKNITKWGMRQWEMNMGNTK